MLKVGTSLTYRIGKYKDKSNIGFFLEITHSPGFKDGCKTFLAQSNLVKTFAQKNLKFKNDILFKAIPQCSAFHGTWRLFMVPNGCFALFMKFFFDFFHFRMECYGYNAAQCRRRGTIFTRPKTVISRTDLNTCW